MCEKSNSKAICFISENVYPTQIPKQIKENPESKEIPVVILTNLSDYDKVSDALSLGAMDYLVKANYRLEDLVNKIKTVLERKQSGMPNIPVGMPQV